MRDIIKHKIKLINQLTKGNVIFGGSISTYFNNGTNEINDIDIIIKDKIYFSQLQELGEIKPSINKSNIFGDEVDPYYINSNGVIIDIFIRQNDIETKEIILDNNIIKIRTLNSQIEFYKNLSVINDKFQNTLDKLLSI
jgi:outer membrane protein OmpA-like peptidoglycan-associated protein